MIGKQLKLLRESKQKTQEEVCSALNIEQSTLANYENGKRMPRIEILIKIAEYYQCSIDYLLGLQKFNNTTIVNTDLASNFKERIYALMQEQGISTDEFFTQTDLHLEDDLPITQMLTIDNLIMIAKVLDTSIDYLVGISKHKRISTAEDELLQLFNRCDEECRKYLLAKAGVLCVEGIAAATESSKYIDNEKKQYLSNGINKKEA